MKNFSKFIILFDKKATSQSNYDPDAQLFFDAELLAGVSLSTIEKDSVNQLVLDLKLNSLWSKMKFLYPFVGSSATAHKFNLKDPRNLDAAYRLVFNGGGSHNNDGYKPNGVNAYASTFLIPNTVFGAGFASIGTYVNQSATISGNPIGSSNMNIILGLGFVRGGNKASTSSTALNQTPNNGFIVNSRTSSTSFYFMNRNGAFQLATVTAVSSYAITDIVLGATNNNGTIVSYSDGRIALSYCSDFITQAESTILKTIVQTFQTTLGRQV